MAIGRVRRAVEDRRTGEIVGYLDNPWKRSLRYATLMDIEVGDIVEYATDRRATRRNGGQAVILRKVYFRKHDSAGYFG